MSPSPMDDQIGDHGGEAAVSGEPEVTQALAAEHGLKAEEYARMLEIMGRTPSFTELGIFSVMWSEHCSYKSSKRWLKTLPTTGPQVIQGPGENAGVVDIGDGLAAVFKMESHNHPSYIEPYQGAATGVGGILRDVFTMGARPVANLNALRFGSPDHPRTRHILDGVVAGIGGYGNCIGVPTVGGEINFHPAYNGNCLVNAMTVGIAPTDRIFYAKAAGLGNPVVYVGSKTGRDGIHGATMASAEFSEDTEEKRPTVQVGDPFTEKLLLEACLELMATDAIVAIQDMGAAGLTSSSVEMADKGGLGIALDLDHVPMRETGMAPYEIMLSESQERMLMVIRPDREDVARAIFEKWELDFAIIGRLTDTGRIELRMNGVTYADIPVRPLVDEAPEYDRPWEPTVAQPDISAGSVPAVPDPAAALLQLIGSPDLCSRRWVWEQYDSLVRGDTAFGPGAADAAIVRVGGPDSKKAIALTTDCTPRYCLSDPERGGAQAVAEAWRNLTATGALPLAVTDNMNFGNPERPNIMGQFVGCIAGMRAACIALDFPVVSGNVSLYNETQTPSGPQAILPTPAIGAVGLLPDIDHRVGIGLTAADLDLILVGTTTGHLGASLYLRELHGREDGPPPPVDLPAERRAGDFVRERIAAGQVAACHDLSDGGLAIAVAEMVMAGTVGASLDAGPADLAPDAWLFGEDQGRYLLATSAGDAIQAAALAAGVAATRVGRSEPARFRSTGDGNGGPGPSLTLLPGVTISAEALRTAHESWLPGFMAAAG